MTPSDNTATDIENWTTQLRKGLLELCVMSLLAQADMYGYDLVKRLSEVKGLVVTEGTIYPLLARLKRAGLVKTNLVETSIGPARKYYSLSVSGRRTQRTMSAYWRDLIEGVERLNASRRS